jgi:hypothetical protein
MASKALSFITGFGDYEVKENSIVSKLGSGSSGQVPMFLSAGGCCRLSHREFLGTVTSAGAAFNITSYPINPFNANTFPWLSEIAGSFETFRMRGMVVEFVSTYGDAVASTNAALGSVILATQYNTTAPAFQTQNQMENYQFATSCKPSVSMIHPIECDPSQLPLSHLYVFNVSSGANDPRWSTLGTTYLATVGQQAAATIGELWISFDVEFYMPKLISSISSNGLGSHYSSVTSVFLPGNFSSTNVFPANFPSSASGYAYVGDLPLAPYYTGGTDLVGFSFPAGLTGVYMIIISYAVAQLTSGPTFGGWGVGGYTTITNGRTVSPFNYVFSGAFFGPGSPGVGCFGPLSSGDCTTFTCCVQLEPPTASSVSSFNLGGSFTGGFTVPNAYPVGVDLMVFAIPFAT